MNPNDIPGTGDYSHTAPTGHPLDPRTDDEPDTIYDYLDCVRELWDRAYISHCRGDTDKAWQYLREIKAELEDV